MASDQPTAVARPSAQPSVASSARVTQPAEGVRCPDCHKRLEGEPNFCPSCGADIRGISANSDTLDGPLKERLVDNRYRILEKLGEGGMGAVYKVEHVRMGKLAALKLMRPDHALDRALKARFLQEARVVAKLSHQNTVQVFDSGELPDGGLFIAMEYVPGKDLAWHLKAHGAMGEAQALSVAIQILASLQEAHEAGVVHRDLKPANMMLVRRRKGSSEQVKLLDFGIAKLQESEGRKSTTGDFVGTPAYMSPEQIRGDPLDARSDLYSLGCVLFELVTGHQPFEDENAIHILGKHAEAPVPRIGHAKPDAVVSPGFQAIIDRAMAKKSADRWPDADAMRTALEQLQRSLGAVPAQVTPLPVELTERMLKREDFDRYERQLRLQRSAAPVVALAFLVFLALLAWRFVKSAPTTALGGSELEPNDMVEQATPLAIGRETKGTIGASTGDGDRDLFIAQVEEGPHRLKLSGVVDLNLTVEVLQLEQQRRNDGTPIGKLTRRVFLDDAPAGEGERLDGLQLSAGEVYLRIEEKAFCTEPGRHSRERSLVPYVLTLEPQKREGFVELEPNDNPLQAQALPLTRALVGWTGANVDYDAVSELRPDAPFTTADWYRIDAAASERVKVLVVPPVEGSLIVTTGAFEEGRRSASGELKVSGDPVWIDVPPMADGKRRLRVLSGPKTPAGEEYLLAAATTGDNGLAAVLELTRILRARADPEVRKSVLISTRRLFEGSPELSRLEDE